MEDNNKSDIMKNYKEIKTEKGKECYLEKDKYILYYSNTLKNGDKIFRCKYYKDKNIKCKAFLKISSKGELVMMRPILVLLMKKRFKISK